MNHTTINWQQTRRICVSIETGEYWVYMGKNKFMLDYDYIEGGTEYHRTEIEGELYWVGTFTNWEIDQNKHVGSLDTENLVPL